MFNVSGNVVKPLSKWFCMNFFTFSWCIYIYVFLWETHSTIPDVLKMIYLPFCVVLPFGIVLVILRLFSLSAECITHYTPLLSLLVLLLGFSNVTYMIFGLLYLCIKPADRTIVDNIKAFFTLENLKYFHQGLAAGVIFFGIIASTGGNVVKALEGVQRMGIVYLISLLTLLLLTYRASKKEEAVKTQKQIQALFNLFEKHQITETTYPVICQSCSGENLLDLGEGKSCHYCGAWLSRKEM